MFDLRPFELLRDGWHFVQPHYFVLLAAFLLMAVLHGLMMRFAVLGTPALFLLHSTFGSGIFWYLLEAYQGRRPRWTALFEPIQRRTLDVIALHAMVGIMVLFGLLLLLLPGFYLAVSFWLSVPILLYAGVTPLEAMRRSHAVVHRQLGDFLLVALVFLVLNTVALIPLGLGLLFTLPASCGATTLIAARVVGLPAGGQGA